MTSYLLVVIVCLHFSSCVTVFSELQSARTVGEGRFDITPSYSTVGQFYEGESEGVQNHIGFQAAYGISSRWDIRARYERVWVKDTEFGEDGVNVLGFGPKYSLLENKIAAYLPVGVGFFEGGEKEWQVHPTLLFTLPLMPDKAEVTFSPKYLIDFNGTNLVATNLGFAFGDLRNWAIRPEFGLLFNPGEQGSNFHFSVGFTKSFGAWK